MRYEILRLEHIGKITNEQLQHCISFNLYQTEALCIVTEDLDSKLYLLDILQGKTPHEYGNLYLYDKPVVLYDPKDARSKGLYSVREDQLIFSMNVAHNLYMTNPAYYSRTILKNSVIHQAARKLLQEFSLEHIKTTSLVRSLSDFDRYLLSILHAVAADAKIIILDTPYNIYQPTEIKTIQHIVKVLLSKGLSILWFTNKWDVMFQTFNRFGVIKNGVVTQITPLTTLPPLNMPPHLYKRHTLIKNSPTVLEYTSSRSSSDTKCPAHFILREGEILGIYGSNTHLELMISKLLTGKTVHMQELLLYNKPYDMNLSQKNHIAFIYATEDKLRVFPQMNLYDNVTLLINKPIYNQLGFRNDRIRDHIAISVLKAIHGEHLIHSSYYKKNLKNMSSLDRLKVEIAKWLCVHPKVFIFVNPHNIYDNLTETDFGMLLDDLHNMGVSILILSASQENLTNICTRVISSDTD